MLFRDPKHAKADIASAASAPHSLFATIVMMFTRVQHEPTPLLHPKLPWGGKSKTVSGGDPRWLLASKPPFCYTRFDEVP